MALLLVESFAIAICHPQRTCPCVHCEYSLTLIASPSILKE